LFSLATNSFEQKSRRHKQNLLDALKYHPSGGALARCMLAWSGMSNTSFERMRKLVRGPRKQAVSKN
jgi:hypothetical protein